MKRKLTKILASLLCVVMIITAAPLSGFVGIEIPWLTDLFNIKASAEDTIYSGTCGENLTWTLDTDTGVLDITGTGDMTDWSSYLKVPWISNGSYTYIKIVNIGNYVTSITNYTFFYCKSLTSVTIGKSVKSIGSYVFYDCTSLTSITIPDSITSIGDYVFYGCVSLTSIIISDSVTRIGVDVFWGTDYYNNNSNWKDDVLYIGNHLIKVKDTISSSYSIRNGTRTIAGSSFKMCDKITDITIPNSVVSIGNDAFYGCDSLTSITIGNSVTRIGDSAFYFCDNLTNITIPDSVTSIGDRVFYGCDSLVNVEIPCSVETIGQRVFSGCCSLEKIIVDSNNLNFSSDSYGVLFNKDKTLLIQYPLCDDLKNNYLLPTSYNVPNTVTVIGDYAFENCVLESVILPDTLKSIGVNAFNNCFSIKNIVIPKLVTSIGNHAFSECNNLISITVDTDNKNYSSDNYGVLFDKNKTILIQYPNGNRRTSYIIPESVTSIGSSAFDDCDSLASVTIPDSVTSIGNYAFMRCNNLTNITIPDSVTSIGDSAFLSTAYYDNSNNWTNGVLYIGDYLIDAETSISGSYTIKEGTFVIANSAFDQCLELNSVTIPNSVTSIGASAFYVCFSLTDVYYSGTEAEWNEITIEAGNDYLLNANIHFAGGEEHKHSYSSTVTKEATCSATGVKTYTCSCGDTYTEVIEKLDHSLTHKTVASTCKVQGYEYDYCSNCKGEFNKVNLPLADHTTKHVRVDSTCKVKGYEYDECTVCGAQSNYKELPFADHSLTHKTVASTCKVQGYEYDYCSNCKGEFNKVNLPLADHTLTNKTVASTCKVAGYEYDYCSSCKGEFNKVNLPLADHTTKHVKVDSTCKVKGYEYDECTACGTQLNYKELPLGNHKNNHITVPSTCKVQGMEYDLCTVCGQTSNTKVLPLADHTTKHIRVDSTCKVAGYEYDECTVCGTKLNQKTLPLADHTWGEWEVTTEPTTSAEGVKTRKCSVCGDTETASIPMLQVITDEKTGIEIEYSDEYDAGIEIEVEEVYDGNSFQLVQDNYGKVNSTIFDINTFKDGVKVQPSGKVKVRIPLPEGFSEELNVFVCYVDSVNGTVENIPATVVDGYIEFEAEHFSHYAVVQHIGKVNKVTIDDFTVLYKDPYKITPKVEVDENVEYTVTYTSSDNDVVTVDKDGNITTKDKGTAKITVTVTDEFGNEVKDTCNVEVKLKWWQWLIWIFLWGWAWY